MVKVRRGACQKAETKNLEPRPRAVVTLETPTTRKLGLAARHSELTSSTWRRKADFSLMVWGTFLALLSNPNSFVCVMGVGAVMPEVGCGAFVVKAGGKCVVGVWLHNIKKKKKKRKNGCETTSTRSRSFFLCDLFGFTE